jgi:hypothetical protein
MIAAGAAALVAVQGTARRGRSGRRRFGAGESGAVSARRRAACTIRGTARPRLLGAGRTRS